MEARYTYRDRLHNKKAEAVALVLTTIYANLFEIELLEVRPRRFCGMGLGGRLMKIICADADSEGVALQLTEAPDLGQKKALRAFYERFGFKVTGRMKRHHYHVLRREPA